MGAASYLEDLVENGADGYVFSQHRSEPIRPSCRICGANFDTEMRMVAHLVHEHRHPYPMLLLNGKLAPGRLEVFAKIPADDVEVVDCSSAIVRVFANGPEQATVTPEQLPGILGEVSNSCVELCLIHSREEDGMRAEATYSLDIQDPDLAIIRALDEVFIWHARRHQLGNECILNLHRTVTDNRACRRYADALQNYINGTKARANNPSIGFKPGDYPQLMLRSYAVLLQFESAVARVLTAMIHFDLNLFGNRVLQTGIPPLDSAQNGFSSLLGCGSGMLPATRADLPEDLNNFYLSSTTYTVATSFDESCQSLLSGPETRQVLASIQGTRSSADWAREDLEKFDLLELMAAERSGNHDHMMEQAEKLRASAYLSREVSKYLANTHGIWALEEQKTNGGSQLERR